MPATIASLGSAFTTTAGNKTVTATPTNGDLIIIIVATTGASANTVSDNATGGTYTQVDSTRSGFSTSGDLRMYVRNALVSGAGSTIYTATQTSSTGGGMVILRVTGMAVAGASAVRSSGGQSTGTAGTTPAPVLSLTPLASNPIISAVASANTVAGSVLTQRTGYTEDFDNVYSTPSTALEVAHLASGETSATLTAGGTSTTAFASIAIELQFNSAPTVALNTPADTATGVSTAPDLAFTGTDADSDTIEYEVQVDTVNTFNSVPGTPVVINSFDPGANNPTNIGTTPVSVGQTFQAAQSGTFSQASFKLKQSIGSPSGNVTVSLWNHTGTFGTTGVPTGAALSTSTTVIAASTLTASFVWYDFSMPTVSLVAGTAYVITANFIDAGTSSVGVANDTVVSSPDSSDPGNRVAQSSGGVWSALGNDDIAFKVGIQGPGVPLLDKLSVTPDATFTDVTNGAHTHPFVSGEQVKYTVQAGDTLTGSTVYYWRVRGLDPSGTNTYGGWAATRSFTTASAGNPPVGKDITPLNNNFGAYVNQAVNRLGSF